MAQVIEQEKSIQAAINKFRKIIKDNSFENEVRRWVFPNGEKDDLTTYKLKTNNGILGVGIPGNKWNNRIPHLFTLSLDKSLISPDVEINIPLALDRSVSGVYVKNKKDIWLCSRGDFTAYRGKIKRDITFSHFNKWLLEVKDGEKSAEVIPIAALTSPDITNQISVFVSSVNKLKELYKSTDNKESLLTTINWNNEYEFEGSKTKNSQNSETNYEYLHGPICNDLHKHLEGFISKKTLSVRKNKNIDLAIVKRGKATAIFEIKTSYSLSEQLYKGIGQLLSYRHLYGTRDSVLFLVIPLTENKFEERTRLLIEDLGIHLVEYKRSSFKLPNGTSLSKFIKQIKLV